VRIYYKYKCLLIGISVIPFDKVDYINLTIEGADEVDSFFNGIKEEIKMLYKEDIIKILKDMDLPLSEYWITSGAALVIHGVKETTNDIDLGCNTSLVEHFIKKRCNYRVVEDNSRIVQVNDTIEILENWFVDEIVFIDGLPVGSLESIRKQKAELGREKDIKDIRLIDASLLSRCECYTLK
jgi:hypothetical protein